MFSSSTRTANRLHNRRWHQKTCKDSDSQEGGSDVAPLKNHLAPILDIPPAPHIGWSIPRYPYFWGIPGTTGDWDGVEDLEEAMSPRKSD